MQQDTAIHEELTAEPRLLYSNRSYWYPQAPVTDYATGVLRLTVPDKRACVASGTPASGNPVRVTSARGPGLRYVFLVNQPARYFSTVIPRLAVASDTEVTAPSPVSVAVQANPRQMGRGRALSAQAAAILGVYGDVLGDYPYRTLTLAAVDDALPGGHSPAYFALVNQPMPATPFTWARDPVAFDDFPQFFLAHEMAHQFWGGAVGWEKLPRAVDQRRLRAILCAALRRALPRRRRVEEIRRKLRTTATAVGDQGPIWLGYRLGHLKGDGRVFRATVYNKSALVLHMLRRWMGDAAFFRGLRALYGQSRYTKIGTGRAARLRDRVGARPGPLLRRLDPDADMPRLRASFEAAGASVSVRIDQLGPVMDVPVTVSIVYASGATEDHLVKLSQGFDVRAAARLGTGPQHRVEPRRAGADRRRTRRRRADAAPATR